MKLFFQRVFKKYGWTRFLVTGLGIGSIVLWVSHLLHNKFKGDVEGLVIGLGAFVAWGAIVLALCDYFDKS